MRHTPFPLLWTAVPSPESPPHRGGGGTVPPLTKSWKWNPARKAARLHWGQVDLGVLDTPHGLQHAMLHRLFDWGLDSRHQSAEHPRLPSPLWSSQSPVGHRNGSDLAARQGLIDEILQWVIQAGPQLVPEPNFVPPVIPGKLVQFQSEWVELLLAELP